MRIALTKKLEKSPTQRKKRKKRFSIWTFEATSGSPSLQIWYSEMSDVAHVAGYSSQLGFVLHVFFIFHMEYDEYELHNARTSFLSTFDFLWVFDCLRSAPRGSFCVFVWRVQPWSLQEQWRTMGADTGSHLCTFFFSTKLATLCGKNKLFFFLKVISFQPEDPQPISCKPFRLSFALCSCFGMQWHATSEGHLWGGCELSKPQIL